MAGRHLTALAAVTIVAAAIRLLGLDTQSFWYDESFTVRLLDDGLGALLAGVRDTESTPPLYYLVAWGWAQVLGAGEVAVRSLSVLLGTALVPVAYLIGVRATASRTAGLVAALVVALNPLLIWYSQEARAYALVTVLLALGLWLFLRAVREDDRGTLVAWAVVSALALAAHYFAIFPIAAEAVMLLRAGRGARAAACAGVGVAALALVPLALSQRSQNATQAVGEDDLAHRTGAIPKQMLLGGSAPQIDDRLVVAAAGLVGLLVALAVLSLGRRAQRPLLDVAAVAVVTAVVPVALALVGLDYVNPRNVVFAVVPLAVLLGAVAASPRGRLLAGAAVVGVCALGVGTSVAVTRDEGLQRDDWRGFAGAVSPGPAAIVLNPAGGMTPLSVYLPEVRRMPATGARVETIWAMTLTRPPRASATGSPPPGFTADAPVITPTYVLERYRATKPRAVAPDVLTLLFDGARVSLLVLP